MFKIKVHANNMASSMKNSLYREIKRVTHWGRSDHFNHAIATRGIQIPLEEMQQFVQAGELIEYHTNEGSRRVVVRHMQTGICMTLNLDSHDILTSWYNDIDDNHKNLDKSQYFLLG